MNIAILLLNLIVVFIALESVFVLLAPLLLAQLVELFLQSLILSALGFVELRHAFRRVFTGVVAEHEERDEGVLQPKATERFWHVDE